MYATRNMPRNRKSAGTWIMFVMVMLMGMMATAMGCPSGCTCKWKGGKQTVECVNKSLSVIPAGMDAGTQVLDMSGNPLDELSRSWFMAAGLSNLQKIFLARCRIGRVDNAAFQGLSNLVELDLSDNGIAEIPTKSFDDYPQLMKLVLSSNAVTAIRTAAFKRLAYLTVLDLSRCQLTVIEPGAFDGLRSLEWLRLDHNRLVRIEGAGAGGGGGVLPLSLHGIEMHHNPWMCDCRMRDVHRWLNNNSAPHTVEPTCHGPDRLRGASVRKLAPDELACAPEARAVSPVDVETDAGRNLTLACRVTPTGEARVSWWFEGRLMAGNSSAVAATDGSVLSIEDVGPTHNGTYSCVAENRAGRAACNFTVRVVQKPSEMAAGSYPPDAPPPAMVAIVLAAGSVCFVVVAVAFAVCCRLLVAKRHRRRAANGDRIGKSNGTAGAAVGDDPTTNGQPAKPASDIRQSDSVNLTVSSTVDGKLSSAEDLSVYGEYDPLAAAASANVAMAAGAGAADTYEVHEVMHMGGGYDAYRTHAATAAGHSTMTTTLEANPDLISDASTVVRDNVVGDYHHDDGGEVYKISVPSGPGGHDFWSGSAAVVYSSGGGGDSYELQLSPSKLTGGEPYPPDYGLPKFQPASMGYPSDYGLPKMGSYPVPPPPSMYRTLPHRRNAAKPQGRACQEAEFVLLQQHQHHHHHHHHHQQQQQQQQQQSLQHFHPNHHHHQQPMHYEPQNVRYNQQGYPYPAEGTYYATTAAGAAAFYEPPSLTNSSAQTLDDETMMMMMVLPPPPPPSSSSNISETAPAGRYQQQMSAEQQQKHKAVTSVQKQTANTESPDEGPLNPDVAKGSVQQ